jgi:hypothetical protein
VRPCVPLLLALAIAGCGGSPDPERAGLQRVYARLLLLGSPESDTTGARRTELRQAIDSLGGDARLESLLVESMVAEPDAWRAFLDSLAKSLP